MIPIIISVILSIALLGCLIFLIRLKKDISSLKKALQIIKCKDTNLKLTTETFDRDICGLAIEVNEVIDKLQMAVVEAERTNSEFRQGISNISHDLRTPLTSAAGYIQMILDGKVNSEKKEEYLHIVGDRLNSLTTLMRELFEYTQIVEGQLTIQPEKVNVGNVLLEKISTFYEEFTAKGFDVQIDVPEKPVYVFCDTKSLQRVCQNLVENALIHGQEQFCFKIKTKSFDGKVRISFANKVSLDENIQVERLFERFYTSDASRTSKKTGLGLSIVKELVERMEGNIVASLEEDTIVFELELERVI